MTDPRAAALGEALGDLDLACAMFAAAYEEHDRAGTWAALTELVNALGATLEVMGVALVVGPMLEDPPPDLN